ncbi:hypothetical protein BJ165DRAFT_1616067 [Panaeolus papilionaceus]|nr:hypothetical protein BJ165DRAFT_1616067 [Panaeolus papilionaceus]
MSPPATAMDLTPPVSPPSTPSATFQGRLAPLAVGDDAGIVVVGHCRSIGWIWGCRGGRGGILDFESRLGGAWRRGCGMREGVDEVVGKEEDEGVRVDIDWSDVPAFNTIDVSSV